MSPAPRFLSADDVASLLPSPAETTARVETWLGALGAGAADAPAAGAWQADFTGADLSGAELRGAEIEAAGALAGRKGLAALLDAPGGKPVLVLERAPLVAARLAACTAVAAKHLADPAAEVITLLGCNARGRAVMAALLAAFPDTERMLCWDPDVNAQNAFADEIMTTFDVASIIPPEPRECTEGAHILVSALDVPAPGAAQPVVEPDWLQTGTLCVVQDLDATFTPAAFAHADRRLTDHLDGLRDCIGHGHLAGVAPPSEELGAVVAGRAPGRGEGVPILSVLLVGHPALDAALAAELMHRAQAAGKGTPLSA